MNREKIGEALRQKRKAKKMKQKDVADLLDLSVATISAMERGQAVKLEKYEQYAVAMGLGEQLFGIESEAKKKEHEIKQKLLQIEKIVNTNRALKQLEELEKREDIRSNNTLFSLILFLKGRCYFNNKVFDKAQSCFKDTLELIEEVPDLENSNIKACCLNDLGRIAYYRNDLEQALELNQRGLDSFVLDGERKYRWYSLLLNRAIYLDDMHRNEKALRAVEELEEAIISSFESGDIYYVRTSIITRMYYVYASVLNKMNMLEKALDYTEKGIDMAWLNRDYNRLFTLWTTAGIIYFKQGNLKEAENYFFMALDIEPNVESRRLLYNYTNLIPLLIYQKDLEKAKVYIDKLIKISKDNDDQLALVGALSITGKWYLEQKMFTEAIPLYQQAEEIAEQNRFLAEKLDIFTDLCTCYKEIGDETRYIQYTEKVYQTNKEINFERR